MSVVYYQVVLLRNETAGKIPFVGILQSRRSAWSTIFVLAFFELLNFGDHTFQTIIITSLQVFLLFPSKLSSDYQVTMDGSAADSSNAKYTAFELYVPLPYRSLLLLNIGLFLWNICLDVFAKFRIDFTSVMGLTHPDVSPRIMRGRSRTLLTRITALNAANYLTYIFLMNMGSSSMIVELLPLFGIICTFSALLYPSILVGGKDTPEAAYYRQTWSRIIKGNIDITRRTNDILLSDTITSYSKVIVDFLTYLSALLLGYRFLPSEGKKLPEDHMSLYNMDILLSYYPSMVRIRQSWMEYKEGRKGKSPLYNCIKYITALIPIIGTVLYRARYVSTLSIWYWGMLINTTFSFIWDVSNDWDLGVLKGLITSDNRKGPKKDSEVFREGLSFPQPYYVGAVLIDMLLRYIWIWRLIFPPGLVSSSPIGSFFSLLHTTEEGRLILEFLEIVRRWVWIIFRVDADYCKLGTDKKDIPMRAV